jgi:hypothetical protein
MQAILLHIAVKHLDLRLTLRQQKHRSITKVISLVRVKLAENIYVTLGWNGPSYTNTSKDGLFENFWADTFKTIELTTRKYSETNV